LRLYIFILGMAWRGSAGQGTAWQGEASHTAHPSGWAAEWRGKARHGTARLGKANITLSQQWEREAFGVKNNN
jgi:hypothetical protein